MERKPRPEGLESDRAHPVSKSRWAFAARGMIAVAAGLLALLAPGMDSHGFLTLAGAYLVGDGLVTLASGVRTSRSGGHYGPFVFEGCLSLAAGVLRFVLPDTLAIVAFLAVGIRCIATGGVELALSHRLRQETGLRTVSLWFAGGASVLFGSLFLLGPSMNSVTMSVVAAVYALIFGFAMMASAAKLKAFGLDHPAL